METQGSAVITSSDVELVAVLREQEAVLRRALVTQLVAVAEVERRGLVSKYGARSTQVWLRDLLNIADEDAKSRVVVARRVEQRRELSGEPMLPDLPATAACLQAGEITVAHARAVADGLARLSPSARPVQRQEAEALLARESRTLSPRQVRVLAERIRYHLDQDGALREEQHQIDTRELHYTTARDGMTVFHGKVDRETGAKLRAALEPLAAPRPDTNGAKDPRSAGKRNADALADLLDLTLASDALPRTGGQRPHITVTIDYDGLREHLDFDAPATGGTLETTGQPITAEHTRRIACDAEVLPIILNSQGQPLDIGRSKRTAPAHLRAALLARDGPCAFPGCDHPPGTSEAHHLRHWADGGATALHNMTMLCAHHHRTIHTQRWHLTLTTGRPIFTPPRWIDPTQTPRPGNQALHQQQLALSR